MHGRTIPFVQLHHVVLHKQLKYINKSFMKLSIYFVQQRFLEIPHAISIFVSFYLFWFFCLQIFSVAHLPCALAIFMRILFFFCFCFDIYFPTYWLSPEYLQHNSKISRYTTFFVHTPSSSSFSGSTTTILIPLREVTRERAT